jgi:biopolymer transport protein ExbB/TolQ
MGFIQGINEAFKEGGWGMWPILILSIFSVGLIIERIVYLFFRAGMDKRQFMGLMQKLIAQGNVAQAIKVCSGTSKPMTRIVQAGLMKVNKTDADVQAAMDEMALKEKPLIEKRTGYLAMNCTAFGLGVGIISLLFFSILNGKTQAILDDIDEVSAQVMNLIAGSRQAAPPQH